MAVYCSSCGKASPDEAHFCASCGHAFAQQAAGYVPVNPGATFGSRPFRTLVRPRMGRKAAGVCQGLANHYGWDVTVVRIVMLLLAIIAFPVGFILYGIIWVVAPEEPLALPANTYAGNS